MRISTVLTSAWLSLVPLCAAQADESAPLFYQRTTLSLERQHAQKLPWQTSADSLPLSFDVEVRDATTLYKQEGWFNLSSPSMTSAVMLVFASPSVSPVIRSEQYAPLDVLFIDKQGKIVQILPDIQLSGLEQDIYPPGAVLAFLFLKGGTCAALSINPGDEVDYPIFKKPPTVWVAAPEQPAAQPQPAPVPTPLLSPPPAPSPQPAFLQAPPKSKIQSK